MKQVSEFQRIIVPLLFCLSMFGATSVDRIFAQENSFNVEIPKQYSSDEEVKQQLEQLENSPPFQGFGKGFWIFISLSAVFSMVLNIWLLVCNYTAAASIPAEYRQVNPVLVLLLLIPCLNLVMNFIVWLGIANGFKGYFASQNRTEFGDCGYGLSLAAAICIVLIAPVGLILWVLATVKFNALKRQIGSGD